MPAAGWGAQGDGLVAWIYGDAVEPGVVAAYPCVVIGGGVVVLCDGDEHGS